MSAEGLHALNTSYPVRSLAERETTGTGVSGKMNPQRLGA